MQIHAQFLSKGKIMSALTRSAKGLLATVVVSSSLLATTTASSSAHTGDMAATAVCDEATGTYNVTVTLQTANVPSTVTGTTMWRVGGPSWSGVPTSAAGMDRGPVTSRGNALLTLGTLTLPGNTVGKGNWYEAFTVWKDSSGRIVAKKGSDTQLRTALDGRCTKRAETVSTPMVEESCELGGYNRWTRTTVTPWVWQNGQLVPGTPVVTDSPKTFTAYTAEEGAAKCSSLQPPVRVVASGWVDEAWACGATTVTQTRTVTRTSYVWSEAVPGWVETSAVSTTENRTRPLTSEEAESCEPDVGGIVKRARGWASVDARCTGTVYTSLRAKRGAVTFRLTAAKNGTIVKQKTVTVRNGKRVLVWRNVPNRARIRVVWLDGRASDVVPGSCPTGNQNDAPETGH